MRPSPQYILPLLLLGVVGCEAEDRVKPPPTGPVVPENPGPARAPDNGGAPLPRLGDPSAPGVKSAGESGSESTSASCWSRRESRPRSPDDAPRRRAILPTRALVADPNNRDALFHSAVISQVIASQFPRPHNSRLLLKGASAARKLRELYPGLKPREKAILGACLYNEACTYAQSGELARVVPVLAESYAAGFNDLAQMDLDPELDPARKDPEFHRLLDRMEREQVRRMLSGTENPTRSTSASKTLRSEVRGSSSRSTRERCSSSTSGGRGAAPVTGRNSLTSSNSVRSTSTEGSRSSVSITRTSLTIQHVNFSQNYSSSTGITYRCLVGDEETRKQRSPSVRRLLRPHSYSTEWAVSGSL